MGLSHRDSTPVSSRRLPLLLAAAVVELVAHLAHDGPRWLGRSRSSPNPRTTGCGVSQLLQPMAFRPARGGVTAGSARRARRRTLCSRRHVEPLRYHGLRTGAATSCPSLRPGWKPCLGLPGAAECKTWWRNLCDGAEVDLTLAGRCLHVHSVVLDQKCEPQLTEGASAYLRDLRHARHVMRATRPTPAETTTPLDTAMTKHRLDVV